MDEKIIIKMENYKLKKLSKGAKIIVCVILAVISFAITSQNARLYSARYDTEKEWAKKTYEASERLQEEYSSFNKYLKALKEGEGGTYEVEIREYNYWSGGYYDSTVRRNQIDEKYQLMNEAWAFPVGATVVIPLAFLLLSALFIPVANFILSRPELVLTDKRMYGKNTFGRRMDLPIDSISSVSTIKLFKGLRVATSSGTIKFYNLANVKDFHKEISNLLVERQNIKKVNETGTVKKEYNASVADELKKYKELLDMGAITKEEFDDKKKELLAK